MDPGTVEFLRHALMLKERRRRGWQRVGIEDCESVADHTWGLAMLALVVAESRPDLDRARLLELAIVHDLAEVVVGDLIPGEYAHKGEKIARERRGMEELVDPLPVAMRGRLLARFEELASDASAEARLIHELDKLEMAFQARRYRETSAEGEREREGIAAPDLRGFFESADKGIADKGLRAALEKLR